MRKIIGYILITYLLLGTYSCEGIFDNLEGDLSKMTVEDMLSTETVFWEFGHLTATSLWAHSAQAIEVHFANTSSLRLHTVRAVSAAIELYRWGQSTSLLKALRTRKNGIISEGKLTIAGRGQVYTHCYFGTVGIMADSPLLRNSWQQVWWRGKSRFVHTRVPKRSAGTGFGRTWRSSRFIAGNPTVVSLLNKYTALALKLGSLLGYICKQVLDKPLNPAYTVFKRNIGLLCCAY